MSIPHHGHEHEFEPQYGLPERLPAGERILWQGAPDFAALARHVFHLRKLVVYFAVLVGADVLTRLWDGASLGTIVLDMRWVLPLALLGLGSVALLAWLTARTTVYTLTDRRVVMRLGIVLTVTYNLPLRTLSGAALREHADGAGDISVSLADDQRIAYLQLWPSVRPWRLNRTEPTLRCVTDAQRVSRLLQQAWSQCTGVAVSPAIAQAPRQSDAAQGGGSSLQPSGV
jgi:hypothetical protein